MKDAEARSRNIEEYNMLEESIWLSEKTLVVTITKLLQNFYLEWKILTQMLFRDSDTQRKDTSYDNLSNIDIQSEILPEMVG